MARRAEDMVRRMAGMPSRKEEQRRRKQQEKQQRQNNANGYRNRGYSSSGNPEDTLKSMQEYAEDVEFTETKEYSDSDILENDGNGDSRIYRENQVSDAEYTEIKN